jgi:hypothetical protein
MRVKSPSPSLPIVPLAEWADTGAWWYAIACGRRGWRVSHPSHEVSRAARVRAARWVARRMRDERAEVSRDARAHGGAYRRAFVAGAVAAHREAWTLYAVVMGGGL